MLWVNTKVQCDCCKRDITAIVKVLAEEKDYCCACFSNLPLPPDYRLISTLDYPLYHPSWTAYQELLLLEAIEKHGFGTWQ